MDPDQSSFTKAGWGRHVWLRVANIANQCFVEVDVQKSSIHMQQFGHILHGVLEGPTPQVTAIAKGQRFRRTAG